MPEQFTVFNSSNRDAGAQYNSGSYTVPVDTTDTKVKFTLTDLDIVNEPPTTVVYSEIWGDDGSGWRFLGRSSIAGMDGNVPPKQPGTLTRGITGIKGQQIRGVIYFESLNDKRKKFGVDGETF